MTSDSDRTPAAQTGPAQVGADNTDILRAFTRQPDGTWQCRAPVAIVTPEGPIGVEPGITFAFGDRLGTLDLAEYLEQLGAQFGS